jgi:hypothetical protein
MKVLLKPGEVLDIEILGEDAYARVEYTDGEIRGYVEGPRMNYPAGHRSKPHFGLRLKPPTINNAQRA